jgi:DNA-binding LacI/PurR family transcriptional regulator
MIALQEAGVSIPEDVSIVGFDGINFASPHMPQLSTMRVPRFEIGQLAARALSDLCLGKSTQSPILRLNSEWFAGETLVEKKSVENSKSNQAQPTSK